MEQLNWKQEIELHRTSQVTSAFSFAGQLTVALARTDKPAVLVVPVDYSENMK